jgi:hypothetical protein
MTREELYKHNSIKLKLLLAEAKNKKPNLNIYEVLYDGDIRKGRANNHGDYSGWVYLTKVHNREGIKIGFTNSTLHHRLKSLANKCGCDVTCLLSIPPKEPKKLESSLHKMFSYRHLTGEYYDIGKEELKYLNSIFGTNETNDKL